MPTSKFSIARSLKPAAGDFVCLPYLNGKTAAYREKSLQPENFKPAVPAKAGGSKLQWAGATVGKLYRLDAEFSSAVEDAKQMIADALKCAKSHDCKRVIVALDAVAPELIVAAQEGALLGGYAFDNFKKDKSKPLPVVVSLDGAASAVLKQTLAAEKTVCEYVNTMRDVLNDPPNVRNPGTIARDYARIGKGAGLKISVWGEKKLAKENCGGILGVGMGSAYQPRLVIGEYSPRDAKKHLCLVGKGLSYDAGGYCLKASAGQVGMKLDMGGSAMMFGAACAIARLKLPIKVTVITPLLENRISDRAFLTTSILKFRNGLTAQVDNTDAEGRLALADALCLASEMKPDWIVDSATLTGACVVALGEDIAGAFGTDPKLTQTLLRAGAKTGELFWEMPLHMPYAKQMDTHVADFKNMGGKWGGSIIAALFLKKFVPEKQKWLHLDIAGPGINEEPFKHLGKGAKAFGVKAATELARMLCGVK